MSLTMPVPAPGHVDSLWPAVRELLEGDQCDLPVLPEVSAQLLRLTSDVNCELAEIVSLIKRDQSLTSHLLRIANSVRYSTGVTVSSIQQAVARLGLICVREIVILITCQCRIFDVAGFEGDVRQSFRRSLAAAAFAQEIARIRRLNVEEAFLSGLLHDVGRPVLLQTLGDQRRAGRLVSDDDMLRAAAEQYRVPLAGRLIGVWELPERVSEIVAGQLLPLQAPRNIPQAALLHLAIELASHTLYPRVELQASEFNPEVFAALNLYPEQLNELLDKQAEILEWVNSTT